MKITIITIIGLFFSILCFAGNTDPDRLQPLPEPPDLPDPVISGENIEPQVTIIRKDDEVVEEFRVNGYLYMVKVTPTVGPAYYLIDKDGSGQLDTRRSSLEDTNIPQWVLFRW